MWIKKNNKLWKKKYCYLSFWLEFDKVEKASLQAGRPSDVWGERGGREYYVRPLSTCVHLATQTWDGRQNYDVRESSMQRNVTKKNNTQIDKTPRHASQHRHQSDRMCPATTRSQTRQTCCKWKQTSPNVSIFISAASQVFDFVTSKIIRATEVFHFKPGF